MKTKLLYSFLTLLVIANLALIFMLVKKPHHQKRGGGDFFTEELQLDAQQKEKFRSLEKLHRVTMKDIDDEIKKNKDILFNSFSETNFSPDSIAAVIGTLEGEKDKEVFTFFSKVRAFCTPEQADNFDDVIKRVLHGNEGKHPGGKRMPPHGKEGMPPPR